MSMYHPKPREYKQINKHKKTTDMLLRSHVVKSILDTVHQSLQSTVHCMLCTLGSVQMSIVDLIQKSDKLVKVVAITRAICNGQFNVSPLNTVSSATVTLNSVPCLVRSPCSMGFEPSSVSLPFTFPPSPPLFPEKT